MTALTVERLKEILTYSPRSGLFRWKVRSAIQVKIGDVAGNVDRKGYRNISIDNRLYKAHRLAWLYVTGRWPSDQIDHIQGVDRPDCDRLENLREATNSQNVSNRQRRQRNNTSGYVGVSFDHRLGKYRAHVGHNGRKHHVGCFNTAEQAFTARNEYARRLHGEFFSDGQR
ncbi:HNH endonuclease [Bradyrhizobium macuxiense]|uniref:HNH endonuclease n=1 Tax=Bradyrhizobium macuxiense TaxID=1755647 RepID=UPI0009E91A59|nr:HNH endonuclease [Bradyrhizobium macuxiense]